MWVLLIDDDQGTGKSIEMMLKTQDHACDIKRLGDSTAFLVPTRLQLFETLGRIVKFLVYSNQAL